MDKSTPLKNSFPAIGFGTYHLQGCQATEMIKEAFLIGYRHFDTAAFYDNEVEIGKALKSIDRSQVTITSKVWHDKMGYHSVLNAFDQSLNKLELDQIDLYLIHWPHPPDLILESLEALEELKKKKYLKEYGVSNFTSRHLENALKAGFKIFANQVEYHPYLNQEELLSVCNDHHIKLIAYCPLARGQVFQDAKIQKIANTHGKTPGQVALRWLLQKGIHPIPKTAHTHLALENFDVFDFNLSDAEVVLINQLNDNLRLVEGYYWCHFDD